MLCSIATLEFESKKITKTKEAVITDRAEEFQFIKFCLIISNSISK